MFPALPHLRVLDLSRVPAGPWASQTLADLGSDVIDMALLYVQVATMANMNLN